MFGHSAIHTLDNGCNCLFPFTFMLSTLIRSLQEYLTVIICHERADYIEDYFNMVLQLLGLLK